MNIYKVKTQEDLSSNLISRIKAGDICAETELVEQYSTGVRIMLLKRTGNPQLSDDLCQEALIKTLKKLRMDGLNKPESLAAYIQNTAKNLHIQHLRKEKRYISMDDAIFSLLVPQEDGKGRTLDRQRAGELLDELLNKLTMKRDREVLRRFYLQEQDKADICQDLDLSALNFDRVLYRARQRTRDLLRQNSELKMLLLGSLFDD